MTATIWGIGNFVLGLALAVGPFAALIALLAALNRRDRRRERLLSLVAGLFPGEIVRSDIAIEARCPMLAAGGVVRVDICRESDETRRVVRLLRQALPPAVRLVVCGLFWPERPWTCLEGPRSRSRTDGVTPRFPTAPPSRVA